MTLLLKQIYAFIKLLNSENGNNQVAAGLACGVILGFSPMLSIQAMLVLFLIFFFRIQMGAAFLSAFFFKLVAFVVDPIADVLGRSILEAPGLRPLFVEMYNLPLLPMTRFNNSIIMGSGVIGFVLVVPAFFIFKKLIIKYQVTVLARLKGTKIWKAFAATKFYDWYTKYTELYG
jgi:uncharacterized protein (TIGR03546 family)